MAHVRTASGASAHAAAGGAGRRSAKQLANPISSLVSVPFQFNWEQNVGPSEATRFILNVQPVMPFSLRRTEPDYPCHRAPRQLARARRRRPAGVRGRGILTSFHLSGARRIDLGSRTGHQSAVDHNPDLGTEKWSVGPKSSALKQSGPLTVGTLWNQVWSFSGNKDRSDVSQMFLQPFVAYQASRTWTVTVQSETTANWKVDDGRWTIPINVSFSKLSSFGAFPASYQFGGGAFPVHRTRARHGRSAPRLSC